MTSNKVLFNLVISFITNITSSSSGSNVDNNNGSILIQSNKHRKQVGAAGVKSSSKSIGVVIGSTRKGRIGKDVAQWVIEQSHIEPILKQYTNSSSSKVELIDLLDINLPFYDESLSPAELNGQLSSENALKWSKLMSSYDAYIILTAEYNRGPVPVLLNAIDYLYAEIKQKPMVLISYGYTQGGIRANEHLADMLENSFLSMKILSRLHLPIREDMFVVKSFDSNSNSNSNSNTRYKQLKDINNSFKPYLVDLNQSVAQLLHFISS
ncbi:hypothetical protein DFA_10368 [Cavenderia fasciculata]|uniref:NADPH-dependent FMN reductase-like domain-containing protein n=1 Tax=Cavenderia fasciculata TaxID=261658 RepID=F4QA07_CACFS|nr:uncharacterized protein DFA_10368 [Cavenderia fasciculata]EGG15526.1 hypothetical protein DFA_10368 [Cavenderia fasciculata]|eukprot:XP_004354268.1 hypothetical protein DFA_10368 [Cavenderia fasciculata]